jgi:hypothetical protein
MGWMLAGLVLLMATSAAAQQVYTGTVLRIDPSAGVIVFEDGRMLQTTADSVIIGGNQRMLFSSLRPGSPVTVYQAQPVALRDGRYIVMSDVGARAATGSTYSGPTTAVVPPPPPAPPGYVVAAPPATAVVTQPGTSIVAQPDRSSMIPTFEIAGHVRRADPYARLIVLDDGRKVWLTEDTQVLINGVDQPALNNIAAGSYVVIRSVHPFAGSRDAWAPMREVARGTIVRTDQPGVLVLNDGRTVRTTPDTVVLVDGRPVTLTTVRPGARVMIYQNGETTAIVNEPLASPALVPDAGLRQEENIRQSP